MVGIGADGKGVWNTRQELLDNGGIVTAYKGSRMTECLILFYDSSYSSKGFNAIISLTGSRFCQILISQTAMENVIGLFLNDSRNGKDRGIEFLIKWKGIYVSNTIWTKPIAENSDHVLFLKGLNIIYSNRSHLINRINIYFNICVSKSRCILWKKGTKDMMLKVDFEVPIRRFSPAPTGVEAFD
jgi:hypothetical protein